MGKIGTIGKGCFIAAILLVAGFVGFVVWLFNVIFG